LIREVRTLAPDCAGVTRSLADGSARVLDVRIETMSGGFGSGSQYALHVFMLAPISVFVEYGCQLRILHGARVFRRLGYHVTILTYDIGNSVPGPNTRRTLPIPWRRNYEVGSRQHKIADAELCPGSCRSRGRGTQGRSCDHNYAAIRN
jgi:hypothetical protein